MFYRYQKKLGGLFFNVSDLFVFIADCLVRTDAHLLLTFMAPKCCGKHKWKNMKTIKLISQVKPDNRLPSRWWRQGSISLNVLILLHRMPCDSLAEDRLVGIVPSAVVLFGWFSPVDPALQQQNTSGPRSSVREPLQQPCAPRLRCLRPCPGPCVAVSPPAGSGRGSPGQAVSGWLHKACQTLSRQRLPLES